MKSCPSLEVLTLRGKCCQISRQIWPIRFPSGSCSFCWLSGWSKRIAVWIKTCYRDSCLTTCLPSEVYVGLGRSRERQYGYHKLNLEKNASFRLPVWKWIHDNFVIVLLCKPLPWQSITIPELPSLRSEMYICPLMYYIVKIESTC